jgi:hypothetical protein
MTFSPVDFVFSGIARHLGLVIRTYVCDPCVEFGDFYDPSQQDLHCLALGYQGALELYLQPTTPCTPISDVGLRCSHSFVVDDPTHSLFLFYVDPSSPYSKKKSLLTHEIQHHFTQQRILQRFERSPLRLVC